MAIGDDALAAGIELVPGTAPASDIDMFINRLADEIARRTMAVLGVDRGGTGATSRTAARSNLAITAANTPNKSGGDVQSDLDYLGAQLGDTFRKGETYDRGTINSAFSSRDNSISDVSGRANNALAGRLSTEVYGRAISGTRRALWAQDDGQIGYAASSERYKKFIRPEDVADEQILMLTLVSYQWKAAVAVDDRREMGLIAERLEEAGLGWACFYGENGVEGINYEMIGLALLPAIQRLIGRVSRLEESAR